MSKWWLVIGSPQNWEVSFRLNNIWGVKAAQQGAWDHLLSGDKALIYASSPVGGLIGYGIIRNKFKQDKPLWPEEVKENKVIWPFRFEIDIEYCLPLDRWRSDKIVNESLRKYARSRQMLQMVEQNLATELIKVFPYQEQPYVPESPHERIKEQLLEIGRLQKFIAEKEYNMEGTQLDVVWRRVEKSVPTYVFEVHVKGDLYHDLAKLKHAFDIWNSNIFLVASKGDREKTDKLTSGIFHEIRDNLRFIEKDKVEELLNQKKSTQSLEKELGIM